MFCVCSLQVITRLDALYKTTIYKELTSKSSSTLNVHENLTQQAEELIRKIFPLLDVKIVEALVCGEQLNKTKNLPMNYSVFQLSTNDSCIWKQTHLTLHNIEKGEVHKVVVVINGDSLVVVDWRAYKWNNQTLSSIYLIIDQEELKSIGHTNIKSGLVSFAQTILFGKWKNFDEKLAKSYVFKFS
jgi:hypothetical protein